jgi:hypothetical protein
MKRNNTIFYLLAGSFLGLSIFHAVTDQFLEAIYFNTCLIINHLFFKERNM